MVFLGATLLGLLGLGFSLALLSLQTALSSGLAQAALSRPRSPGCRPAGAWLSSFYGWLGLAWLAFSFYGLIWLGWLDLAGFGLAGLWLDLT